MDFERLMLGSLIRKRPGPRPCEYSRAALSRCERFSCHLRARRSSFCSLPRQNEFHLQATDLRQSQGSADRRWGKSRRSEGSSSHRVRVSCYLPASWRKRLTCYFVTPTSTPRSTGRGIDLSMACEALMRGFTRSFAASQVNGPPSPHTARVIPPSTRMFWAVI
jgi:hypothetical protein